MADQVQFTRDYAAFGAQVKPYEQADDVGRVVTDFMWYGGAPFYAIWQIVQAKVAGIWLGEGERPANDVDNIDLLFRMAGEKLTEIVLRSGGAAIYGGYVFGETVDVTDEIVAGHRVLIGTFEGAAVRYVYDPNHPERPQYVVEETPQGASTSAVRQMRKRRR